MPGLERDYLPDPWIPLDSYLEVRSILGVTALANGTLVATNNDAHYWPINFPCDATVYAARFAAANGTGNYDVGLYDDRLRRLVSSGSTAMSAAGVKELSVPNLRFKAGTQIYLGLALSSTSGQVLRVNTTIGQCHGFGWGMEASALPLPATATPTSAVAYSVVPWFALGIR